MTIRAAITGWGSSLPVGRVTNADLESRLDTTDAWIVERTGIRERRVAAEGETTASLGAAAGNAAIKQAALSPSDIDLLIVTTATPEQPMPETSAFVHDELGLRCGAFDVGAVCAGFTYALITGAALVSTGAHDHVLIVGSETYSRIVDPSDRSTAILFGDGAGAVVLSRSSADGPDGGPGVIAWDMGCDGSGTALLEVPAGGSRLPASGETLAEGRHWLRMDGQEVFRRAVRCVVDSGRATLENAGIGPEDVDLFVPHQANTRIIEAAANRLGIPLEKTFSNLERYGNTSAASIPIALTEAAEEGRLNDGDLVLLSGFGAGMTWATVLLRWGRP